MKKIILALMVSTMTLFSGFTVKAEDVSPVVSEEVTAIPEAGEAKLPSKYYTGIVQGYDGNFYLYKNGKFAKTFTGLFNDTVYGWRLITKGVVNLGYTDLYCYANYGWWKVTNGKVDFGFTGWYTSPTVGTWYVERGRVDLSKGQQSSNTTSTTTTYNDGYSDNTYGPYTATVRNDAEARNAILAGLAAHSSVIWLSTTGGYTGTQAYNCFDNLSRSLEYEASCYDAACYYYDVAMYSNDRCNISLLYWNTTEEEKYLDQIAASIKSATAGMSDYDKLVYIHDYICRACNYDYSFNNYSAYACLVKGTSVCQGYAMAFSKLAEACGFKVVYLASDDHAYNAVYLDGNWYFVDTTWDDGTNSKTYFLRGLNGLYSVGYNYAGWFNNGTYSINLAANDYHR